MQKGDDFDRNFFSKLRHVNYIEINEFLFFQRQIETNHDWNHKMDDKIYRNCRNWRSSLSKKEMILMKISFPSWIYEFLN